MKRITKRTLLIWHSKTSVTFTFRLNCHVFAATKFVTEKFLEGSGISKQNVSLSVARRRAAAELSAGVILSSPEEWQRNSKQIFAWRNSGRFSGRAAEIRLGVRRIRAIWTGFGLFSVVYSGWGLVGSDPTSSKCRQLIFIGAPELSPNISSRSPTSS